MSPEIRGFYGFCVIFEIDAIGMAYYLFIYQ